MVAGICASADANAATRAGKATRIDRTIVQLLRMIVGSMEEVTRVACLDMLSSKGLDETTERRRQKPALHMHRDILATSGIRRYEEARGMRSLDLDAWSRGARQRSRSWTFGDRHAGKAHGTGDKATPIIRESQAIPWNSFFG